MRLTPPSLTYLYRINGSFVRVPHRSAFRQRESQRISDGGPCRTPRNCVQAERSTRGRRFRVCCLSFWERVEVRENLPRLEADWHKVGGQAVGRERISLKMRRFQGGLCQDAALQEMRHTILTTRATDPANRTIEHITEARQQTAKTRSRAALCPGREVSVVCRCQASVASLFPR
jgi:hypothetical protein